MAIEEQLAQEEAATAQQLSEDDERDLEMAVLLGKRLVDEGGAEVLEAAATSSDPGQVIGQFLMQLGSQMNEAMPPDGKLSPAIFLAEGGWLEQMSDFLQEEYDISREVADRAEIYVATSAQQMAQSQQAGAQQQPAAPQAEAPVLPAGGM